MSKKVIQTPIPTPAGTDWRWPLDEVKLKDEMLRRRIVLYSHYHGRYRRKITWLPYANQFEVKCEDSTQTFESESLALEKYNDEKLYVSNKS